MCIGPRAVPARSLTEGIGPPRGRRPSPPQSIRLGRVGLRPGAGPRWPRSGRRAYRPRGAPPSPARRAAASRPGPGGRGQCRQPPARRRNGVERHPEHEPEPEREHPVPEREVVDQAHEARVPAPGDDGPLVPAVSRAGSPSGSTRRRSAPERTRGRTSRARCAAGAPSSSRRSPARSPSRGPRPQRSPSPPRNGRRCAAPRASQPRAGRLPPLRRRPSSGRASCRTVRTVASDHLVPRLQTRRGNARTPAPGALQGQPAGVEGRRPELRAELLHRRSTSPVKTCSTTPTSRSLWNGTSTCSWRDEVDRGALADRAVDGEPEPPVAGREQEERRREHGPRALLRVAEEAPRPLPRPDARGGEVAELVPDRLDPRGHEVEEDAAVETERRPVELVVADEPVVLVAAARTRSGRGTRPGAPVPSSCSSLRKADSATCASPR